MESVCLSSPFERFLYQLYSLFQSEKPTSYDNAKKIMAVVESHIMNDT
jgi:hypothetical protein